MRAFDLKVSARFARDVQKCPGAGAGKDTVRLAVGLIVVKLDVIVDVRVDGEEVFETVVVEIEQSQTPSAALDGFGAESALPGRVGEEAFAEIPEERVGLAFERRDDQIGQSVVVVIAKIHAHSRYGTPAVVNRDARCKPTLLKTAAPVVAKEKVGQRVVGDEDVNKPVIVIIGNRHAHSFADVFADPALR